ncbi:metallophosphoesterase family protein [Iamia sp. SCSIO 61187]|uniref:metallophosphoesterase family protein n=1 Tax=Iamia sp. SCSIO 61187 TaxID=2722752 RepID=UPI001C63699E|nr:metallophosphoesterase family protein [Iamia sp. SCSIO 61187]QYG91395.1 metallophosphoesterase family protein [Iamia sp. SCSIO 61187]
MRALVLADTHLTAATLDRMPAEVWDLAAEADVVLHAGDVLDRAVLDGLRAHTPVHAVQGNNDEGWLRLPDELVLDLDGAAVAMVHDSGPTAGRHRRMARAFPEADVVVFGHSHAPLVEREGDGPLLVNPGSPTHRRRQPVHTVAWLDLAPGRPPSARIVEVGPLASP